MHNSTVVALNVMRLKEALFVKRREDNKLMEDWRVRQLKLRQHALALNYVFYVISGVVQVSFL